MGCLIKIRSCTRFQIGCKSKGGAANYGQKMPYFLQTAGPGGLWPGGGLPAAMVPCRPGDAVPRLGASCIKILLPGQQMLNIIWWNRNILATFDCIIHSIRVARKGKRVFFEILFMNLYIGNLSWGTTEEDLQQLFEAYGEVSSCKIIKDKVTNRSKGFGFVEMPNNDEANQAISALNGKDVGGRNISVNEARPREERPAGGGFRGGNRGGNYGGGYGGGRSRY